MNRLVRWLSLLLAFFVLSFSSLTQALASPDTLYDVQKGDTLWGIAQSYHTSVSSIVAKNDLRSDLLRIHQHIKIPVRQLQTSFHQPLKKVTKKRFIAHTVRAGETLWAIALENHTTIDSLIQLNHLQSNIIHPGQRLHVEIGAMTRSYVGSIAQIGRVGVPVNLISVYQGAGRRYGIPWTILAAIHRTETRFSTGAIESYAGAEGPMQFMPSTFEYYAVKAPGQSGQPNINNVADAIYTCAHMLCVNGFQKDPTYALFCYNHSVSYIEAVREFAARL